MTYESEHRILFVEFNLLWGNYLKYPEPYVGCPITEYLKLGGFCRL